MVELREYQRAISQKATELLRQYKIAYLSMEVRTGKSLTALAAADEYGAKNVLFLTKKKAISSPEGDYEMLKPGFELTVINYEQLHNISGAYDLIICDESHCLGQYPIAAERVKLLKAICAGLPVIYLSGTPTPESYSQLYHQFYVSSFSPFGEWKNFYKWAVDFVIIKKKYYFNRQINDYSGANKEKIDELTKHLFLSYTQEEAGFTSAVQEEILEIEMQDTTYFLADKLKSKRIHIGKDGQEILADTEVKLMNKLHQVYSGTVLGEDGNAVVFDYSKARFIKQIFAGKRFGIFYKFKAEYGMILATFGYENITSDPDEFRDTNKIFVSQIQSGREGINLSSAECLVMLNIDYSSVSYWQARARMQDKNRTDACKVYWIFSKGGIEQKIYAAVQAKKDYTLNYFRKDYKIKNYAIS